jgi:hypothetical protein
MDVLLSSVETDFHTLKNMRYSHCRFTVTELLGKLRLSNISCTPVG